MRTVRTVLAVALAMTAAGEARAANPLATCQGAIVTVARRLFDGRYKAFARCETAQAGGAAVTCTEAEPGIAAGLAQVRATVGRQLASACPPPVLAQATVGAPCAAPADTEALADCLAAQVSGPRAGALLETAYDGEATVADEARFACQKGGSKAMRKLANARQKTRAACAAGLAAGKGDFFGVCPDAKTRATLERFRAKAMRLVEKKCGLPFAPEPDPDLDLGEPCEAFEITAYDRGPGGGNALPAGTRLARCLVAAAAVAADATSRVAVPLPDRAPFRYGVAAGDTTPVAFVAWTHADGPADVDLEVATNPEFAPGSLVHTYAGWRTPARAAARSSRWSPARSAWIPSTASCPRPS